MTEKWEIQSVRVVKEVDCDPDLSWLDQTDAEMGEGFEAESARRKESYGETWCMVGMYAEAELVHKTPQGGYDATTTIRSGGLWGTESDSDSDYFQELAGEELSTLRGLLADLGLDMDGVAVEHVERS
jgi:hypothetical protein